MVIDWHGCIESARELKLVAMQAGQGIPKSKPRPGSVAIDAGKMFAGWTRFLLPVWSTTICWVKLEEGTR
jgi:hypothetical protein